MDERPTSDAQRRTAGERLDKGEQPAGEPGSDQSRPSAEQIAERVYELLCQDLRLERERRGR